MRPSQEIKHVAILGAGAIGFYVGAAWASALHSNNVKLTLVGRPNLLALGGARQVLLTGRSSSAVPVDQIVRSADADAIGTADVILVAVKATSLQSAIDDLRRHAKPDATIISLLNGLQPMRELKKAFPEREVVAGMVPFNVVWKGDNHLHSSSAGNLTLARSPVSNRLVDIASETDVPIDIHDQLEPLQYGKLLLNLVNPINALSGLPLHQMLSERAYRKLYAATLEEALAVYDQADINWKKVGPFSPKFATRLLGFPDFFFNNSILKLQKIDKTSTTSMAFDLQNNRKTEIDVINGEIVRLAEGAGAKAPINGKLVELVHRAEQEGKPPKFSALELKRLLGI